MAAKTLVIGCVLGAMSIGGGGCATNTETGAAVGGASGAAIGASVFRTSPLAGAVLGGAFGALTGAAIGNAADRDQVYRGWYSTYPPPPPPYASGGPPPFPGAMWHPGYWVRERGGWFWVDGYWF
jgi:hypothetical protein